MLPLSGSREANKCSPAVTGGLEQPICFCVWCIFSATLSLSIFLCASLSQLGVPRLASWPPPFFLSLSLKALIGLLGIKPGLWERRGTFGSKMGRGTVAAYLCGALLLALWKPSLQGGGSPLLHACGIQLCSTCCVCVTLCFCSSVGRQEEHNSVLFHL